MVRKWVKKPIEVEAVQWTGDNWEEVFDFVGPSVSMRHAPTKTLVVKTLEGEMQAHLGDYIIEGIKDEFYPCRKDIFLSTYEEVD